MKESSENSAAKYSALDYLGYGFYQGVNCFLNVADWLLGGVNNVLGFIEGAASEESSSNNGLEEDSVEKRLDGWELDDSDGSKGDESTSKAGYTPGSYFEYVDPDEIDTVFMANTSNAVANTSNADESTKPDEGWSLSEADASIGAEVINLAGSDSSSSATTSTS